MKQVKTDWTKHLKNVRLMGNHIFPYLNSKITVERVNEAKPCQNYILRRQLNIMAEIDFHAHMSGIDISDLNDSYLIYEGHIFMPPVLEIDVFGNGELIINDGMHRVAHLMGKEFTAIVVHNPSCPYYAYPTEWSKVITFEDDYIPEDFKKKEHRIKEYKKLYRDFNSVFDKPVGKPRGKGNV